MIRAIINAVKVAGYSQANRLLLAGWFVLGCFDEACVGSCCRWAESYIEPFANIIVLREKRFGVLLQRRSR
jgi:hypothetical protein